MKRWKILTVLMTFVLAFSLTACSANKDSKDAADTSDIASLTSTEPSNLDEATKLHQKLMQKETDILSSNTKLWEKVFLAANKKTTMIEDGTNYGDFLLSTIEGAKDQFSAEELQTLKTGAEQIKEIEGKLTILEQKYPDCGSKSGDGESVDAESAGMTKENSELTKFPSFTGKDLDGNDVNSSDLFSKNDVTVVNFWFTTCKPCVEELKDLEALNTEFAKKGVSYRNVWFDSKSDAGTFTSGLYSYPTTYVVDKNGNIIGQPIVGAITSSDQAQKLHELIEQAIASSNG